MDKPITKKKISLTGDLCHTVLKADPLREVIDDYLSDELNRDFWNDISIDVLHTRTVVVEVDQVVNTVCLVPAIVQFADNVLDTAWSISMNRRHDVVILPQVYSGGNFSFFEF